jgi:LemA protein
MIYVYIIIGVIVIGAIWIWGVYNGLISLKNRTDEAWSDIDVQTKRRYDLIPNLVESVKGYATHEREAFENVTRARASAMGAQTPEAKGAAENVLSGALKSLFAVAEAYPDLKASQNFMKLQEELSDTENKIQAARRFYNGNVRDLNIKIEQFPTNVFAKQLGFTRREFFAVENEAEKQPVQVKF